MWKNNLWCPRPPLGPAWLYLCTCWIQLLPSLTRIHHSELDNNKNSLCSSTQFNFYTLEYVVPETLMFTYILHSIPEENYKHSFIRSLRDRGNDVLYYVACVQAPFCFHLKNGDVSLWFICHSHFPVEKTQFSLRD